MKSSFSQASTVSGQSPTWCFGVKTRAVEIRSSCSSCTCMCMAPSARIISCVEINRGRYRFETFPWPNDGEGIRATAGQPNLLPLKRGHGTLPANQFKDQAIYEKGEKRGNVTYGLWLILEIEAHAPDFLNILKSSHRCVFVTRLI